MLKYIVKRLLLSVPLVLGIVTATFFMAHLAPGDPMDMYLEPQRQRQVDLEVIELLRKKYGLDQPIHVQYVTWLKNVAQGDFGESFRHRRPVKDMLVEAVPYTLQLTVLAIILDALIGITIGIISAVRQYSKLDKTVTIGSLIIYAIPSFWLALMLIMVFSVNLGWFPTSQTRSMNYEDLTAIGKMLDRAWHLVLPVFVMGIAGAAGTARYMRNKLLEVLNEEYIMAARARGFREKTVIVKHALRNAMIPIVTIYGMSLPFLLGGAVVVEVVFGWPGMGRVAIEAIWARDYPVIMATTLVSAVTVVAGSLLADVLYRWADPRVRHTEQESV